MSDLLVPWSLTEDGESWGFATSMEEAIADAREEAKHDPDCRGFWVGDDVTACSWWAEFDAEQFLDCASENSETAPFDEGWVPYIGANKDQLDELTEMVQAVMVQWAQKHGLTRCYWYCWEKTRWIPFPAENGGAA